jgi:hypothetical protein
MGWVGIEARYNSCPKAIQDSIWAIKAACVTARVSGQADIFIRRRANVDQIAALIVAVIEYQCDHDSVARWINSNLLIS